jgi:inosose dehydratase
MSIRLATGPVSWGVDFAGAPGNPPWREVLDGTAAAGYRGLELGPFGYFPADVASELRTRGLTITAGFVFQPLHDPAALSDVVVMARVTAARVASLGGRYLTIIDMPSPGGSQAALVRAVTAVAEIARSTGLRPLVHPHAGTRIGFDEHLDDLLEHAGLCLDTGHALYAGADPVELYGRHAGRIPYLHLKDLDPARVERDFWDSVKAGAFRPLGQGALDVARFAGALADAGFDGWGVVEQDRVPGGDPVPDLIASRTLMEALV